MKFLVLLKQLGQLIVLYTPKYAHSVKGRTTSWIAELPNFEHVPHFIEELSANCSQTFITINLENFEAFCRVFNGEK